jgi:formate-dependent phosphoribosylglycinamide formyltransferase (GAR transformylase)
MGPETLRVVQHYSAPSNEIGIKSQKLGSGFISNNRYAAEPAIESVSGQHFLFEFAVWHTWQVPILF